MTHKEYLIDRMRWAMGLYGIMNCFDRKEGDMAYQAFAAMRGGMKMIQLRECKNIDIDEFLPNARLISHEIERNGSTESAINQIREKRYFASLEHYSGELLFVGINYDETDKTHQCQIQRFVKEQFNEYCAKEVTGSGERN